MNTLYANKRIKLNISIASFSLYFLLYCLLFNVAGRYITILAIFPLTYVAWSYGKFIGTGMGIFGVVISTSLGSYFSHSILLYDPLVQIAGLISLTYLGCIIGWFSDTRKELKKEIILRQKAQQVIQHNYIGVTHLISRLGELFFTINNKNQFSFVNQFFETLIGYSQAELLNKSIYEFLTQNSSNLLSEELLKVNNNKIIELSFITKSNSIIVTKTSLSMFIPVFETDFLQSISYYAVVFDITAYQKKEEGLLRQIEEKQLKLEAIVELIPEGLLVLNLQGIILLANQSFKAIFKTILQHDISEFYTIHDPEKHILINSLSDLITSNIEKEIIIEPLIGLYYKLKSIFIKKNSSTKHSMIIIEFQDITNHVTVEKFQKQIISTVTHELRVPLTNVSLSAMHLKNHSLELTVDQKNHLYDILNINITTLNDMVEDLLTYEKFSIKSLYYSFLHFNINEAIGNVVIQLEPKIQHRHLTIVKDTLAEYILIGDQKRIEQAIRIVLDNAIKYSPENSAISIVSYLHVNSLNQTKEPLLRIVIEDHGIGIPKEDIPHIFKRFFRSNNVKNHQGTGIGLSLAKEIIDYHGGSIYLNSELNQFTSVTIELPNKN